ncbi:hypothetical protein AK830_g3484 [Neonectria ditissima]|uniref:Rhodopsin domain-containing protein n=1 Tax=Neonectria ditissima TaxID=78410 RepID=A0A0P7BRU1_9HYPO|nr:hypothetical protein AK830_g3484 [Neonectria ditissima]
MANATSNSTIYNTPLVPPPAGVKSNFDVEWTDAQTWTVAVFSVMFALATASLVIRYVTSFFIVKKLEADVVLITLAWGASLCHFISMYQCMQYGWGRHSWDITVAEGIQLSKHLVPGFAAYIISPALTKLAILTVIYHINPSPWFRISTYAIGLWITVYTIVYIGLLAGPCNPVHDLDRTCTSKGAVVQMTLNIASDLAIIVLPLPTLWRLQMPRRQKMVTGGILTLGSAVLIASIARAPYVALLLNRKDLPEKVAQSGGWSMFELNLGIVCSNLMRMKPFVNRYLPGLTSKLELSSRSGGDSRPSGDGTMTARPSHSSAPRSSDEKTDGGDCYGSLQLEQYGMDGNNNGPGMDNRSTESILRQA